MVQYGGHGPVYGGMLGVEEKRQLTHHHNGAAGPTADELRALFQHRLMESIGLTAASLQRVSSPEVAQQALAAADMLKRKARSHRGLNEELLFLDSSTRQALEQAQAALAAGHPHALEILHEVAAEIGARVPILLLLPESGLIDRLIAALEEAHAENRLGEDEDRLLVRLRALHNDLQAMNWSDEAAWDRLANKIERLNEAGPTTANIIGDGSKLH
jgi:hypothetical protein